MFLCLPVLLVIDNFFVNPVVIMCIMLANLVTRMKSTGSPVQHDFLSILWFFCQEFV